jgi:hypothetical protein
MKAMELAAQGIVGVKSRLCSSGRALECYGWFQQLTRDKIIAESLYQVYRFLFLRFHRFDLTTMIPLLVIPLLASKALPCC